MQVVPKLVCPTLPVDSMLKVKAKNFNKQNLKNVI